MEWIAPGAVNLINKLPRRPGTLPYEPRKARLIQMICHYAGDPVPGGSLLGYRNVTAESTALYQISKDSRLAFPEIAYHFVIQEDATLVQCLPIWKRAWHAGDVNDQAVGVLFCGHGYLGIPSSKQIATATRLRADLTYYEKHFVLALGHKDVGNTACPGLYHKHWVPLLNKEKEMDEATRNTILGQLHGYWSVKTDLEKLNATLRSEHLSHMIKMMDNGNAIIKKAIGV